MIRNVNDMDLTDGMPEDTEENGYPLTEHFLQMDVFKGISGLIDRGHYEHARAWATLEIAEVNYRTALAAQRQAAALERIAAVLEAMQDNDNLDESVNIWGASTNRLKSEE